MTTAALPAAKLKKLVRDTVIEILEERPEFVRAALEDIALTRAIEKGAKSGRVSREEVFAILRPKGK